MGRFWPRVKRVMLQIAATLVICYLAVCALLYFNQRHLVFPVPEGALEPQLPGAALLRIPGPEGTTVYALHVPAPPEAPTVVHFHGNGEQLAHETWLAQRYQEAGFGFLAVEYPGYGLAQGKEGPTEQGIYAASEAALGYLHRELGVPRERTVLQGQSIGSGVAAEMARRGHGTRLVLITPYTSIVELGARLFPWVPARLLVKDRFDTASKAPGIHLPVFIVHGTRDSVVPVDMGKKLGTLFPRVSVRILEGKHHNNVLDTRDIREELFQFARGEAPLAGP